MKFAVKTVTCLGCKTPLKTNKGKLSEHMDYRAGSLRSCMQMALCARIVGRDWESSTRNM